MLRSAANHDHYVLRISVESNWVITCLPQSQCISDDMLCDTGMSSSKSCPVSIELHYTNH
jgi:hypothetical protein